MKKPDEVAHTLEAGGHSAQGIPHNRREKKGPAPGRRKERTALANCPLPSNCVLCSVCLTSGTLETGDSQPLLPGEFRSARERPCLKKKKNPMMDLKFDL